MCTVWFPKVITEDTAYEQPILFDLIFGIIDYISSKGTLCITHANMYLDTCETCFVEVGFAQHFKNQVNNKAKQNPHMPLKVCKYAFCAFPSLRSMLVQKVPI